MGLTSTAEETIVGAAASKLKDVLTTAYGDKKDTELQAEIEAWLQEQYGEHEFFPDFNAFLSNGNVIGRLIGTLRTAAPGGSIGLTEFVETNATHFFENYPQRSRHSEQVRGMLNNIYRWVSMSITHINNPYSADGRLQSAMAINQAEQRYRDETMIAMMEQYLPLLKALSSQASQEVSDCTGLAAEYKQKIEDIEKKYQHQNHFREALDHYTKLLQSIAATEIHGTAKSELLCSLYCNIAICHANIGREEDALSSLQAVPTDVAESSANYHYVYAAILVQYNNDDQYNLALEHVQTALRLRPEYPRAYLLQQHLHALLKQKPYEAIIQELENYYGSHSGEFEKDNFIGEYYELCGLIGLIFKRGYDAYDNFALAVKSGYDEEIAKVNMLSALYMQAVENVPWDHQTLAPDVDNKKLTIIWSELKDTIQTYEGEYTAVKRVMVKLYAAVCSALKIPHNLSPLEKYLCLADDYESLRLLILGSPEELTEDVIAMLKEDDAIFVRARQLLDKNCLSECYDLIIEQMAQPGYVLSISLTYMLLQLCIKLRDCESYWKYRSTLDLDGIGEPLIKELDAVAHELDNQLELAKKLFDDIVDTSNDYHILENAILFYLRNAYISEGEDLFLKIQSRQQEQLVHIPDLDEFCYNGIAFLVKNRRLAAIDFFDRLPKEQLTPEILLDIEAIFYSATNDMVKLCDTLERKENPDIRDKLNQAICLRSMCRYDEGIEMCLTLASNVKDEEQLVKIYELLSDLYLLNSQMDESYTWAEKAHQLTMQHPYDMSHRYIFSRAFRCGHPEGLKEMTEYQRTHPNVISFFKIFHVDPKQEKFREVFLEQLEENLPVVPDYADKEAAVASDYRNKPVPINLLLEYYGGDWERVWQFAIKNKLRLGSGNPKRQQLEESWVGDDIVVDAETLMLLYLFGCLSALQGIKHIHLSCGTVLALQNYYLSLNFDTLSLCKLMEWISTEPRIVLDADGIVDESNDLVKAFSREFFAACNVAVRNDIPFLCADTVVSLYQAAEKVDIPQEVRFVSIPVICNVLGKERPEESAQMIYRLLEGGTFISFSAGTMLEWIRANDYNVPEDSLGRFLICKSDYDMESFARVYLGTAYALKEENETAAHKLSELLLHDANRIWKRGTYHRELEKKYNDIEASMRAAAVTKYVVEIVSGMREIWKKGPADISKMCDDLQNLVSREL